VLEEGLKNGKLKAEMGSAVLNKEVAKEAKNGPAPFQMAIQHLHGAARTIEQCLRIELNMPGKDAAHKHDIRKRREEQTERAKDYRAAALFLERECVRGLERRAQMGGAE